MSRSVLLCTSLLLALCVALAAQTGTAAPLEQQKPAPTDSPIPATSQGSKSSIGKLLLEDGTPIKLRLTRNLSSADARVGDTVDFEVLEEVRVADLLIVSKGGVAWGTVTEAQAKRRMARGGKLGVNIDSLRLIDGEKVALRAVKEGKGGGHTGAMTGAMIGTAIVFSPAAPLFLFMHGKDITIPKGTEITAYINGNVPLELTKFGTPITPQSAPAVIAPEQATLQIDSVPPGADIEIDGAFYGNTPSSVGVSAGEHVIKLTKPGFKSWERKVRTTNGTIRLAADLEKQEQPPSESAK